MNIGTVLLENGDINQEQLRKAVEFQRKYGGTLSSAIIHLNLCSEQALFYAYTKARDDSVQWSKTPFTFKDIRKLMERMRPDSVPWLLAFIFGVFSGVLSMPVVFSNVVIQIIDVALPAHDNILLKEYLIFAMSAIFLGFVFYLLCWLSINLVTTRLSRSLYVELISSIRSMPASMYKDLQIGYAINLVLSEVEKLTSKVRIVSSVVFQSAFGLLISVLLLFSYDVTMAAVAILLIIFSVVLPNKISAKATVHTKEIPKNNADFFELNGSYLRSGKFFRLNGFVDSLTRIFSNSYKMLMLNYFSSSFFQSLAHATKTHLNLVLGVVVLWLGSYLIENDAMTVGEIIGFYFLVMMQMYAFNNISGLYGLIVSLKASWGRIEQFLSTYPDHTFVKFGFFNDSGVDIQISNIEIERNHVKIVKNCSMEIKKGEVVGIIGGSGSGKSSLLQAIVGILPTMSGSISIGGSLIDSGEHNVPWIDVCYIPQSPFMFNALSIKDNITLYSQISLSDEQVWDILDTIEMKEPINNIPGGIHARGSLTSQLSTGQIQRLCLARVLAQKNRLLLMDEPTSNLDNTLSKLVFQQLKDNAVTVVFVTHNMELLEYCDRIINMDDGHATECFKDVYVSN